MAVFHPAEGAPSLHLGSGPTPTTLSINTPTFARLTVTKQNREQPLCTPCRRHASRRSKILLFLHFLTLICRVHEVLLPPPPALSGHPTNNHRFGKLSPLLDHNHGAATTAAHTTTSQLVDSLLCASTRTLRSSATNTRVHIRTSANFRTPRVLPSCMQALTPDSEEELLGLHC